MIFVAVAMTNTHNTHLQTHYSRISSIIARQRNYPQIYRVFFHFYLWSRVACDTRIQTRMISNDDRPFSAQRR